ncbi:MAG: riboflavin biosynthesis protein RibF [Candidatus Cryptobacteroides sp.]
MAVAATGFFDGVHLGHREVLKTLVSSARERGEEALVITFSQHPRTVLQQDAGKLRFLTTPEEKRLLLESAGAGRVETIPFTREFASLSARDYISELLVKRYGVSSLILGYDNRLGSDRLGAPQLRELCAGMGMDARIVPPYRLADGSTVSSTKIRGLIASGKIEEANAMLGGRYMLSGVVVSGKQLGRTIGFPTANTVCSNPLKLVPGRGVYVTEVTVQGRRYYGMTNVGDVIETNIFDFDESIYGLELGLRFITRIRDMRAMNGLEELKKQLSLDRSAAREIISSLI